MKKLTHNLIAVMILPASMLISNPAVSGSMSGSDHQDLFLENVYEDYTIETGNITKSAHQETEFAAMETEQSINDADLFLENEYEDYTIVQ